MDNKKLAAVQGPRPDLADVEFVPPATTLVTVSFLSCIIQ